MERAEKFVKKSIFIRRKVIVPTTPNSIHTQGRVTRRPVERASVPYGVTPSDAADRPSPPPSPGTQPQPQPRRAETTAEPSSSSKKAKSRKRGWVDSCATRTILCERQVARMPELLTEQYAAIRVDMNMIAKSMEQMKVGKWFEEVKGYISSFVREFYTTLEKDTAAEILKAKVKEKIIIVTPDTIAEYLGYARPASECVTYPRVGYIPPKGIDLAEVTCKDLAAYRAKGFFTQGMLLGSYAIMNKIIHYNLFPRGAQKTPREDVIQLAYELCTEAVVDLALLIWTGIADFYDYCGSNSSLPFGCMISSMCINAGVKPLPMDVWVPPPLGAIDFVTIHRSEAASRGKQIHVASFTPPVVVHPSGTSTPTSTARPATADASDSIPTFTAGFADASDSIPTFTAGFATPPPRHPTSSTDASDIHDILARLERTMIEDRAYAREETARRAVWETEMLALLDMERVRRVEWERRIENMVLSLGDDDEEVVPVHRESDSEYICLDDSGDD